MLQGTRIFFINQSAFSSVAYLAMVYSHLFETTAPEPFLVYFQLSFV